MIKKSILFTVLLGSLLLAAPSLIGTNGLVRMPAATSVTYKEFDIGVNWELLQTPVNGKQHKIHYLANLGIFDGVELGFLGDNSKEGVFINLKYYMLSDKSEYPLGLAVGLTNLASHTSTDLYLVLSKKFPNKLAGHLGFSSNLLAGKIKANVMFGMEMFLSEQMTVIGDVIGSEDSWILSAGLRLKLSDDATLNTFYEDISNSTADKGTFSIGISMHNIL